MKIVDRGNGPPLVFIPGLQGRWEFCRPTVEALARRHRVVTFSLCDERGWGPRPVGADGTGIDPFVAQVTAALDECRVSRAILCGYSFGGRVALSFAARYPTRVSALVLVSTPGPGWKLRPSHRSFARHPWIFAPVFFAGAPTRLGRELRAALPNPLDCLRYLAKFSSTLVASPLSPSRMGARALTIDDVDIVAECATIQAPTLIVSGEPHLDHIVAPESTQGFAGLIAGARSATLARSGHLGCMTRPEAFADLVDDFLTEVAIAPQPTPEPERLRSGVRDPLSARGNAAPQPTPEPESLRSRARASETAVSAWECGPTRVDR